MTGNRLYMGRLLNDTSYSNSDFYSDCYLDYLLDTMLFFLFILAVWTCWTRNAQEYVIEKSLAQFECVLLEDYKISKN